MGNEEILKKIIELEQRLNVIENHKKLKYPVLVEGSLELPKIIKVNSSEFELVDIYNDIPHFLVSHAIKVSLTADTYRQRTQGEIFLEKDNNGNYWIITTENNIYWLLPKVNIKINSQSKKTLALLFNCDGCDGLNNNEFILIKPARVSPQYNQKQWKLEEQGELEFTENSPSSQLQTELLRTKSEHQELRSLIKELNQANQQTHQQFRQQIDDLYFQIIQILDRT